MLPALARPMACGMGTAGNPFTSIDCLQGYATGTYYFNIGGNTFQGYVDGTTDGGGWVEILNYLHQGGTNPALTVRTGNLPLQTSATLGANESSSSTAWGHAAPALVAAMNPLEIRFYGQSSGHSRIMHFKTSLAGVLSYLKTGSGSMTGIGSSFTPLAGHTANLPAATDSYYSYQNTLAATEYPFYTYATYHWSIKGGGIRWEMDDYPNNESLSTLHRMFVRGNLTAFTPVISAFAPASGAAGTSVTITGTNLDQVRSVRFGAGSLGVIVAQSATSLTVQVPVAAASGVLTLTNSAGQTVSSSSSFTYTPTPAGLTASLSPGGPLNTCQAVTLTASASSAAFTVAGTGFNIRVNVTEVQPNGQVLVGGGFNDYGGSFVAALARLNANGSFDATFNSGGAGFGSGEVRTLVTQADGKILVGGRDFITYNGTAIPTSLIRLNTNGTLDNTFTGGTLGGLPPFLNTVVLQPDGKILVGGYFTAYNGIATGYLLRLNPDGSRDMTFNAGGSGFDLRVNDLKLQTDGKLLVAGEFTSYNGNAAAPDGLVRLNVDGSLDATFNTSGSGFGAGLPNKVVQQADGKILVGGYFASYNGSMAIPARLVRLNADGSLDATFNSGGSGPDDTVAALYQLPNGKILVGGFFSSYNGNSAISRLLIRLNANGSLDGTFNSGGTGFFGGFSPGITNLSLLADGRILAGYYFTTFNGAAVPNSLAALNADGTRNTAPTPVAGASFTFSPGASTTNPLTTSTAGSYSVVASLNGATSAASNTVVLTACPAPAISSLSPTSGVVGTSVTITGTNLTGTTAVSFNGTAATTFTVNSATSITATVPTGATTGSVTVTTAAGTSNGVTFTVTVTAWTGAVSTDWFAAGNWTNGVPTATLDVTIPAGAPRYPLLTAGTANVKALALASGGSLAQSGGTLSLTGNFSNSGTFSATGGLVTLAGSSTQAVGGTSATTFWNLTVGTNGATLGGAAAMQRLLTLNGNLTTSGQPFTLLSTSTGTAMVVNTGGSVVGAATMQRAIDPSLNAGPGYRHYSAPVQNATVAGLATGGFSPVVNPAYNSASTPGTVMPFPTVFGYDEARVTTSGNPGSQDFDLGFFSPSALTSTLATGRGYAVNIAASETVALTGTLNTGTVPVGALSAGGQASSGWHLLGNPYPAPLDWNQARTGLPTGVLDAVYVFKSSTQYTGSYQFYQNGFGTLAGGLVPAMQGFFLRVSQPVASFSFQNAWRATSYQSPTFNRSTADQRPALQLDLVSAQGTHEPAFVYFEQGATPGIDNHFDAEKLPNSTGLNLSSEAAGARLAVNGLPLVNATTTVPLAVGVPTTGTYTLEAASLANFGSTAVYLHDALTGQQVNLQQQPGYSFTASTTALITGRFSLRFGAMGPLATTSSVLAAGLSVYPNPAHQQLTLRVPAVAGATQARAVLSNVLGQPVRELTLALPAAGAQTTVDVHELPTGVYTLRVQAGAGVITKKVVVE